MGTNQSYCCRNTENQSQYDLNDDDSSRQNLERQFSTSNSQYKNRQKNNNNNDSPIKKISTSQYSNNHHNNKVIVINNKDEQVQPRKSDRYQNSFFKPTDHGQAEADSQKNYQGHKKQSELVMLVEDIMDSKHPFRRSRYQSIDKDGDNEQGGIAHDRLRKLFSKRLQRGPKTPPRRIQTDQISNSLLMDFHDKAFSQEACSAWVKEESNPSLLFSNDRNFPHTEQSRQLERGREVEDDDDDMSSSSSQLSGEEGQKQHHKLKKKTQSILLAKVKSECVLPRKKRDRNKSYAQKPKEEIKEQGLKQQSKNAVIKTGVGNKKKKPKKQLKQQPGTQQNFVTPKKSNRFQKQQLFNLLRSGSNLAGQNGTNQMNAQSIEEESNTFGLSMESENKDQEVNINSVNSSNLLLNKKTRTIANISKRRISKNRTSLAQKAFQVAENKRKNVICYWNLFIYEGLKYQNHYKTIKKIGQGGCGEVWMVMHLATDQIRAMKIVNKNSEKIVTSVYDEINILRNLDHPNIVKVYEFFQDEQNLYVIMEYLKGGSLFDRLKEVTRFGEREAAYIMKQVLQGLNYMYSKKYVHRDMKLENVLFVQEDNLQIKIIDFGSAINVEHPNMKNQNRIVTAYYVAPEIINKESQVQKCDVWSCGVILFILLSGSAPFRGKDEQEILDKVLKGQVNFDEVQWKHVSSRAKFLIKQMLEINVKNRNSLTQCISSPWIKMLTKIDGSFRIDMHQIAKILKQLNEFQPGCKLRQLVLHYSLIYFQIEPIDKLSKIYAYMDTRHLANLNERDLLKFAQRIHKEEDLEILLQQQKKIVQKLDFNQSQGITYSNFLISAIDTNKILTSQRLIKLFNLIDKDGDNYISCKDLYMFCGKKLEMDQCRKLIEECNDQIQTKVTSGMNQSIGLVIGQSIANISETLKLNFTNFKNIVLNQGLASIAAKKEDIPLTMGPQNTGFINMNSYLYDTNQRQNPGEQVIIQANQSVQNSGILYQTGINSNTGFLVSPVSQLLKDTKEQKKRPTKKSMAARKTIHIASQQQQQLIKQINERNLQ